MPSGPRGEERTENKATGGAELGREVEVEGIYGAVWSGYV